MRHESRAYEVLSTGIKVQRIAPPLCALIHQIRTMHSASMAYSYCLGWFNRCTNYYEPSCNRQDCMGAIVTVVYAARSENPPKSKTTMLPLLIVLFLASYTILTMLVVEQGRTIEAQRGLLRDMLKDSAQLAQLKGKLAHEGQLQAAGKPAPRKDPADSTATAPNQPKSPAGNEVQKRSKAPHSMKDIPSKPAQDLQDVRRATHIT